MECFNNYGKHLLYTLLAAVILSVIGYGTYTYATHLKQDIEMKKEIQRLENQKLRLEIEILKKASCQLIADIRLMGCSLSSGELP